VIFSPLNIGVSELLGQGRGIDIIATESRVEERGFEEVEEGGGRFDARRLEVGGVKVVDVFEEVVFDI
jgi:hypothetical protein